MPPSSAPETSPNLERLVSSLRLVVSEGREKTEQAYDELVNGFRKYDQKLPKARLRKPFAAWIKNKLSRQDLDSVLLAKFGTHWTHLGKTTGEQTYRQTAATHLGLDNSLDLYLWFGTRGVIENRQKDEKAKGQHYLLHEIQPREILQAKKQLSRTMASSSNKAASQPVEKPVVIPTIRAIQEFKKTSDSDAHPSPAAMSSNPVGEDTEDRDTSNGGGGPQDEAAACLNGVGSLSGQVVQEQRPSTAATRGLSADDSGIGGMDLNDFAVGPGNNEDGSDEEGNDASDPMGNDFVADDDRFAEKDGMVLTKEPVTGQSAGSPESTTEYQDCPPIEEYTGPLNEETQQAPDGENAQVILNSGAYSNKPDDLAKAKQTSEAVGEKDLSKSDRFQALKAFLSDGYHAVKTAMEVDSKLQSRQVAAIEVATDADTAMAGIKEDMMSRLMAIQASACSDNQFSSEA
ncbi:hypothetical protein CKAH01_13797 [Colletotrichum kahawae]|uniref:Uncharacterized protein n=1 Tax=Colletotrichum kahawae TaxID=34407 RepID=A0AAE0DDH7_COLKA|nr:hypothetical protein CKAH01_13797 [Colletotrichum kahawae]